MPEALTSYSNSQGVQLLERAVNEFGPIFTLEQISSLPEHQSLPPRKSESWSVSSRNLAGLKF
jgi:hypothetical protein